MTSQPVIKCKGADDFSGYLDAKLALESALALLADLLSECKFQIHGRCNLLAWKRCLKAHNAAPVVVEASFTLNLELMTLVRVLK